MKWMVYSNMEWRIQRWLLVMTLRRGVFAQHFARKFPAWKWEEYMQLSTCTCICTHWTQIACSTLHTSIPAHIIHLTILATAIVPSIPYPCFMYALFMLVLALLLSPLSIPCQELPNKHSPSEGYHQYSPLVSSLPMRYLIHFVFAQFKSPRIALSSKPCGQNCTCYRK